MIKITFMGAGSTVFARNVIGDCMCTDALKDSVFALYDIDGQRLKESQTILEAMAKAKGAIFLRADGHGVPELLDAILQVIPLDTYVDTPAMIMEVGEQDKGLEIPIWNTYKEIIAKYDDRGAAAVGQYERFKFYDEAQDCYCIIQTGETAIYANIILQKGVIK